MNSIVKDLMVPISDYATISEGATLLEAVIALENAKAGLTNKDCPHWVVLILNNEEKVVGKLSQINVLIALETRNEEMKNIEQISRFGFSAKYITTLREDAYLKRESFDKLYTDPEVMNMRVEDFMKVIAANDFIDENTSVATAAHQMSARKRLSMLVTSEEEVIGVLRLSDVFTAVINTVKTQSTPPALKG